MISVKITKQDNKYLVQIGETKFEVELKDLSQILNPFQLNSLSEGIEHFLIQEKLLK